MAKAVTLKNTSNEEVYPVTDISLVNGGIYADTLSSLEPTTGYISTAMLQDGAVTGQKIDWGATGLNYSTTETDTGLTWVDGKKIYRKVIEWALTASSAGEQTKAHGISNLDNVTSLRVIYKLGWDTAWGNEQYLAKKGITFRVTSTDVVKETASANNWTGDMKIVIEYTKSS